MLAINLSVFPSVFWRENSLQTCCNVLLALVKLIIMCMCLVLSDSFIDVLNLLRRVFSASQYFLSLNLKKSVTTLILSVL